MKSIQNLSNLNVFMVGIGGISMSGLAKILFSMGNKVSGSDRQSSDITFYLKSIGIEVFIGHSDKNITKDIDLVVFSGAIKNDNPELVVAKNLGLKVIERSELLGLISSKYSNVIAISGTHGKTTTTAMIGEIFKNARLNPTIHLGGISVNLKSNTIIGQKDYFILEACEYRNSFRFLKPTCAVITNIEADHLDYYKTYDSIKKAFNNFANNSKYVINENDYSVKNIKFENEGYAYDVYFKNEFFSSIRLNMLGLHNVKNSLFAIAVANYYGIDKKIIVDSLSQFNGVERRYEKIGYINKTPVIIDYAHHPTELKNSIAGIECVYKKILCVFQPHTYSRTLDFFDEFVEVLKCKNLILFKTYSAREKEIIGGRAEDLFNAINSTCTYCNNIDELINEIEKQVCNFDCILVLGAGDLADKLKSILKAR